MLDLSMKKIILLSSLSLFFLIYALPLLAQDRPKGLDNRGPLTKITFIHRKKGHAKPPKPDKPGKPPKESTCYGFLARGTKWKTAEDYVINPTNTDGLTADFITSTLEAGVGEWEIHGGDNIFGQSSLDSSATYGIYDYQNSVEFGLYPDPNVIAVTSVWGYFGGPPQTRELVEWDMLFNDASSWDWGDATADSTLMDLQNIATHELGHSAGMDDLYETTCQAETMYGYSWEGDTQKRDLNPGDIAGIQKLYL